VVARKPRSRTYRGKVEYTWAYTSALARIAPRTRRNARSVTIAARAPPSVRSSSRLVRVPCGSASNEIRPNPADDAASATNRRVKERSASSPPSARPIAKAVFRSTG
jgi:hypothetical protein